MTTTEDRGEYVRGTMTLDDADWRLLVRIVDEYACRWQTASADSVLAKVALAYDKGEVVR